MFLFIFQISAELGDDSDDEAAGDGYYTAKSSKKKEKKRQEREAQRQVPQTFKHLPTSLQKLIVLNFIT